MSRSNFPKDDYPVFCFSAMKIFSTVLILGIITCSCEREKGNLIDPDFRTPLVSSVILAVDRLNLDDTIPSPYVTRLGIDQYLISDTLTAEVQDPRGTANIQAVRFHIYPPGSTQAMASGMLTHRYDSGSPPTIAIFNGVLSFTISRTEIGIYRIESIAADQANAESNHAELSLFIGRANSAPQLGIPTIRKFTPAGSDSTRITLAISAMDSDGYADVASVTVQAHNAPDSSLHMLYDNGSITNGDQALGDGIFSTIIWIPSASPPVVELELIAIDHEGIRSAPVFRSTANHPPNIVYLIAPDSIKRPISGATNIGFYEKVADLDGLSDIDSVFFRNFTPTQSNAFSMYDDGDFAQNGDSTANDAVYSRIVQITPTNSLGDKEFHFYVVDKSGATATIIKFITIY